MKKEIKGLVSTMSLNDICEYIVSLRVDCERKAREIFKMKENMIDIEETYKSKLRKTTRKLILAMESSNQFDRTQSTLSTEKLH
jgi:hypothetical protein